MEKEVLRQNNQIKFYDTIEQELMDEHKQAINKAKIAWQDCERKVHEKYYLIMTSLNDKFTKSKGRFLQDRLNNEYDEKINQYNEQYKRIKKISDDKNLKILGNEIIKNEQEKFNEQLQNLCKKYNEKKLTLKNSINNSNLQSTQNIQERILIHQDQHRKNLIEINNKNEQNIEKYLDTIVGNLCRKYREEIKILETIMQEMNI